MLHMGLRTIGIAAVAAATLAVSGAAWAQQTQKDKAPSIETKASSASASTGNCVRVKSGDCIRLKIGSELQVKESAKAK